MKRKSPIIIAAVTASFFLLCAAYAVYTFIAPNNRVVPAFEEGRLNVVVGGTVIESGPQPLLSNNEILLPFTLVKKYIDPDIYWDSKLQKVTVTTRDRVIRMKTDSLNAYVNNKSVNLNLPVTVKNDDIFIPIEFLGDFYKISITYIKDNNVIVIDFKNREKRQARLMNESGAVRKGPSIHQPIVEKLKGTGPETLLRVFGEKEEWYEVRTAGGIPGYIEKSLVSVSTVPAEGGTGEQPAAAVWKPVEGKLSIVWDYTWGGIPDLSKRKRIEGLDVISPTCFQVIAADGTVKNKADAKYVEWAHANGYRVWTMFSNHFGDVDTASRFLRNTDARDNAIRQLLAFAALYKFDGVNIDFEELPDSDREELTQFVRELAPLLREQGLTVSLDFNTKGCYDRKALSDSVDYMILMAYDQHWAGGREAGSVAEIPWVDRTVERYLNDIPPDRMILGIPFYTRLWKEEKNPDGGSKLTSVALSMDSAKKRLQDSNASVTLDENSGQFYAEYRKDGAGYRVWLEDANSVDLRTSLVHKYKLAGAAAWRLNYETPDIWRTLVRNLKGVASYGDWQNLTRSMERSWQK